MDTLMSLPMTASVLTEYGDLEEACRSCGCDGLEVVWGGEELPCTVPQALHVGYHLTFYPDWLDFWRGDRAALTEKFGSEEVWRSFYGGPEGRETLLRLYVGGALCGVPRVRRVGGGGLHLPLAAHP